MQAPRLEESRSTPVQSHSPPPSSRKAIAQNPRLTHWLWHRYHALNKTCWVHGRENHQRTLPNGHDDANNTTNLVALACKELRQSVHRLVVLRRGSTRSWIGRILRRATTLKDQHNSPEALTAVDSQLPGDSVPMSSLFPPPSMVPAIAHCPFLSHTAATAVAVALAVAMFRPDGSATAH